MLVFMLGPHDAEWTEDPLNGRFYEDIQMPARLIHYHPHTVAAYLNAPCTIRDTGEKVFPSAAKTFYLA